MIQHRSQNDSNLPKVYVVDSNFSRKLERKDQNPNIYTKHIDFVECDFVIVPYHKEGEIGHWYMAKVDMRLQCIFIHDSLMDVKDLQRLEEFEPLKKYFESQLCLKEGTFKIKYNSIMPQQNNRKGLSQKLLSLFIQYK